MFIHSEGQFIDIKQYLKCTRIKDTLNSTTNYRTQEIFYKKQESHQSKTYLPDCGEASRNSNNFVFVVFLRLNRFCAMRCYIVIYILL